MSSTLLNVSNFITLRLKPENYPLWCDQVLALAKSQELTDFLTGEANPQLKYFQQSMELILPPIQNTKNGNRQIVWVALKEAYAQSSQERQFQLNQPRTYMKKTHEVSLNDYLRKLKEISGKKGHPAIRCWHLFNHSVQPDNLPQAFTALQLNPEVHHEEWTSDTGASAHMTSHKGNLHNLRSYNGHDHVMLGNGEFLKVTHIGDAIIGSGPSAITLRDVLLVLELERSLLSVG
ncbi:hypothetical protein F2P56_030558 [Juglans regia]|uniref:Uncharacterized protein LOC108989031 n=2 Tax=Juglans regia TaxID=51240 RepID=A0A2I4EF50_JUGRE|nr:uncharacterized protein LOC108989031 [Juglans regia]KAF5450188.1 hypothetical protein F2P56_030558 [Juglans regia]